MCRCLKFLPIFGVAIMACWPLAIRAADPDSQNANPADTTTVQLPASAFTQSDAGPQLIRAQLSYPPGEPAIAALPLPPQPPAPPQYQGASSRRGWFSLAHLPPTGQPRDLITAAGGGDVAVVNDFTLLNDISQAEEASHKRLKRWLIENQNHGITYSCEQSDGALPRNAAGPNLLPPQQAKPLLAAADAPPEKLDLDDEEPAKVILDIREQVGPKLFEGTIFEDAGWRARTSGTQDRTDQRAQLVRCIRDLQQNREQCAGHCEVCCEAQCENECENHCEFAESAGGEEAAPTAQAAVPALRQAWRQLDQAAELLEEQKLYDRADQLRSVAQQLREQAREADAPAQALRHVDRK